MTKLRNRQIVVCERLLENWHASERHVRLYGEEFHLVSDPVPDGDGFALKESLAGPGNRDLYAFHCR